MARACWQTLVDDVAEALRIEFTAVSVPPPQP